VREAYSYSKREKSLPLPTAQPLNNPHVETMFEASKRNLQTPPALFIDASQRWHHMHMHTGCLAKSPGVKAGELFER